MRNRHVSKHEKFVHYKILEETVLQIIMNIGNI